MYTSAANPAVKPSCEVLLPSEGTEPAGTVMTLRLSAAGLVPLLKEQNPLGDGEGNAGSAVQSDGLARDGEWVSSDRSHEE